MRIGFWPAVYGNWLPSDQPAENDASFAHAKRATLAAERLGFDTLLIAEHFINPNGEGRDQLDAWTAASALAALTDRIEIIAAVKPGLRAPGVVAKMGAAIDRIASGRFAVNLVSAWWLPEYEMLGAESLAHDDRYDRAEEYLAVIRGLWTTDRFDYAGRYYKVAGATIAPKPVQRPHPPIYVGGESERGRTLGARIADIFLVNGRPPDEMAAIVADMRGRAAALGRSLRFGTTGFVVCRETEAAALAELERLASLRRMMIAGADPAVEMFKRAPLETGIVGTNGGWRSGLVGTPQQIADRLRAFEAQGVETFLLQFHPLVPEMERFAAEVMPLLRRG
ncbi:MAG: LLM class flavin-dependent oxidoreductase [Rhodospirillales bacterium]